MIPEERRKRDPVALQDALARLARIRIVRAAKRVDLIKARWDETPRENLIEEVYLRRVRERVAGHE